MIKYKTNLCLKKFNTFGLGGKAQYFFEPSSKKEIMEVFLFIKENNLKYFVLGNGSNIILPDEDFSGVIILTKKLDKINIKEREITVESGVMLPVLNQVLLKSNITSFWWASGIPGTVGGSVVGNAGANNNEIFDDLKHITVYDGENFKILKKKEIKYTYRNTNIKHFVVDATFATSNKLSLESAKEEIKIAQSKRKSTQPLEYKNAGSTFKNPENFIAGKLIDDLGLKGTKIGGAQVSKKHANFIVNNNNASSEDVKRVISLIKNEVKKEYNINLELENKIIEWRDL